MFRLLVLLSVATNAAAHSWVVCTNVQVADPKALPMGPAENDPVRRTYDPSKCHGYPRNWAAFDAPFGVDRGANYQQAPGAPLCQQPKGLYSEAFPMATYRSGSTACAQYPAKNHVASKTTNPFIPDTEFKIYRSVGPTTEDPKTAESMVELRHYNGVHKNGVIDYLGYQNCPDFDNNNDKSTCTVCFDVGDVRGVHSFVWYWEFNQGSPPYTSCWEANVVGSDGPNLVPESPKLAPPNPEPPALAPPKQEPPTLAPPSPDTKSTCSKDGWFFDGAGRSNAFLCSDGVRVGRVRCPPAREFRRKKGVCA